MWKGIASQVMKLSSLEDSVGRNAIRCAAALGAVGAGFLLSLVPGADVRAGQPEVVVAIMSADQVVERPDRIGLVWGSGSAVLSRGSDAGTICYQLAVDMGGFSGDNMQWATSIAHGPAGVDGTSVVLLGSWSLDGAMHIGCGGGLDPAVVSDVFANPHDYYVHSNGSVSPSDTGCESPTDCPDIALRGQLAIGGADCQVLGAASATGEPATTLRVRAGESFWLIGSGFIPWADTEIRFTSASTVTAARTFFLRPDDLGRIASEFTAAGLGTGEWTISAPDLDCEGTLAASVLAGGSLPDTATPMRIQPISGLTGGIAALVALLALGTRRAPLRRRHSGRPH